MPREQPTSETSPLTGSDISDETKKFIADKRKGAEMAIRKRLDRAVEDGELSSDVSTAELAKFYTVVIQGLALQAQHGGHARICCVSSLSPWNSGLTAAAGQQSTDALCAVYLAIPNLLNWRRSGPTVWPGPCPAKPSVLAEPICQGLQIPLPPAEQQIENSADRSRKASWSQAKASTIASRRAASNERLHAGSSF